MSDTGKAVFLSYASQDTEAAKRICEALRTAGVEVWFDQSELVGGDAWDQKIRKQIRECALLIPIVSKSTQGRREAYFRLEWKLADERTHLMAKGTPFLFPITIDETSDRDALVPDSFLTVQWTKAAGGEVPPAFVGRVKKLLDGGTGIVAGVADPGRSPASTRPATSTRLRWLAPVLAGAIAVMALWHPWRAGVKPGPSDAEPRVAPSGTPQLIAQARALYEPWTLATPGDLALAEHLLKQATEAEPGNGEAWAALSILSYEQVIMRDSYILRNNPSDTQVDRQRWAAERALTLAPESDLTKLAVALRHLATHAPNEAVALLRQLAAKHPTDKFILHRLGSTLPDTEALAVYKKAAALPGGDPEAHYLCHSALVSLGRLDEAEAALDRALGLRPDYAAARAAKINVLLFVRGDLSRAMAELERVPAPLLDNERVAIQAERVWYFARQVDKADSVMEHVTQDYIGAGPKGLLMGLHHHLAGREEAAALAWRAALQVVEQRLAVNPTGLFEHYDRAELHALLGEREAAEKALREGEQIQHLRVGHAAPINWRIYALLGRTEEVAVYFAGLEKYGPATARRDAAYLRYSPELDEFRKQPDAQAILPVADRIFASLDQPAAPSPASGLLSPSARPEVEAKSVAVLAFTNLSDDKANEYFSDGISEELLNVLAKIPGLKVAARTSAFYFKGKDTPIPEIAKQLGVAYVVEGSVRKQGNQVRITAQLIKAADGFHVWSENFNRDLKDIFAVQDEIAGLIAKNLELKMGMATAVPHGTIGAEAYQAYLLGRAAAAKASMADFKVAVAHFKQAVALEPKFAAAWVQLAVAHTQLGRWGGAPPLESWREARIAIDQAKELEPDSPDMLLALGWIRRTGDWDWRGAEQAFRRALELRPSHPETLAGLAVLLFNIGQTAEAFQLGREAVRLDPLNPSAQIDLSIMFHFNRDWVEAEHAARRALQLAPGGTGYHSILAWSLIPQRRFAEAKAEIDLETDLVEAPMNYGLLAIARGDPAEARRRIAQMEELARTRGDVSDLQQSMAWLYAPLGEKDRAFAALEKARASRDPSMSWLRNSYYLEALFTDPRWPELLRKVGLAEEQLK